MKSKRMADLFNWIGEKLEYRVSEWFYGLAYKVAPTKKPSLSMTMKEMQREMNRVMSLSISEAANKAYPSQYEAGSKERGALL